MLARTKTLTGKAKLAGVIGWPVGHSLSPRLHGYWLAENKIDGAYVPLAVKPADFADAVRSLPKLGFRGANVTVPHKEMALQVADALTETAQRIGAVNTLIINDDGMITGDNTDAFGFIENLRASAKDWRADAGPAVVLGAGGAARAVVDALCEAGVPEIRIVNRTQDRAEQLAGKNAAKIKSIGWQHRHKAVDGASLLVNTTTLGMDGKPSLDISLDGMTADGVVSDIVYVPLQTPLLKAASAARRTAVDGLGMLLHQARPGFEAWFGKTPKVDHALRRYMLAGLAPD